MELRPPRTLAIVSAAAAWALIVCNAAAQERCRLTAVGTANVVAVRDGRTLMLDDGRELQLAAIEVADDSRNALQSLVGGGPAPTRTAGRRERPLWSAGRFRLCGRSPAILAGCHAGTGPGAGIRADRRQGLRRLPVNH